VKAAACAAFLVESRDGLTDGAGLTLARTTIERERLPGAILAGAAWPNCIAERAPLARALLDGTA
jgi:hypothetical protein